MVERLTVFGLEHWAVVSLNALVCSLVAALLASLIVFIGGATHGFCSDIPRSTLSLLAVHPVHLLGSPLAAQHLGQLGERDGQHLNW